MVDAAVLKARLAALATRMAAERDALCALDGAVGDGDHGIAMEQGMKAAAEAAAAVEGSLQEICNAAAKGFLNAVGASSGPLYATGFLRMGKALGAVGAVAEGEFARLAIPAMRDGIVHRGKAAPGMKTMLDAWHPAAECALAGGTAAEIVAAAEAGAEATKGMVAGLGRAERLGDRVLGHMDPGAASAVIVVAGLVGMAG